MYCIVYEALLKHKKKDFLSIKWNHTCDLSLRLVIIIKHTNVFIIRRFYSYAREKYYSGEDIVNEIII